MRSSSMRSLADDACQAFTAYREGDVQRLGDLVHQVTPILWRTARQHCPRREDAEEAVQNTWLRLVDHAHDITDPQAVLGWLLVTVRREAWHAGGRDRHTTVVADPGAETEAPDPTPEAVAVLSEGQRVLWDNVKSLSPACQYLICVIAYATRPDYATIAENLGIPVGSIGPTRGRCLAKLKAALVADPRWKE